MRIGLYMWKRSSLFVIEKTLRFWLFGVTMTDILRWLGAQLNASAHWVRCAKLRSAMYNRPCMTVVCVELVAILYANSPCCHCSWLPSIVHFSLTLSLCYWSQPLLSGLVRTACLACSHYWSWDSLCGYYSPHSSSPFPLPLLLRSSLLVSTRICCSPHPLPPSLNHCWILDCSQG